MFKIIVNMLLAKRTHTISFLIILNTFMNPCTIIKFLYKSCYVNILSAYNIFL